MVLPFFLALFFGVVDLGRCVYQYVIMGQTAETAARMMSLPDNKATDCTIFTALLGSGNGYSIVADPNSIRGDADPSTTPSAPTAGSSVAANGADLYLYPAVAAASPPSSSANCGGSGATRGTKIQVDAQVTYRFVPWTPVISQIGSSITLTVIAKEWMQY